MIQFTYIYWVAEKVLTIFILLSSMIITMINCIRNGWISFCFFRVTYLAYGSQYVASCLQIV